MRLRLYHHRDGARVAYREVGAGPPFALLHSRTLSYREWEPVVGALAERFRVVAPDLPLHGDSEDRPRHPYTLDWMTEVMAGFCTEVCGPRARLAGHDLGAEILLQATASGLLTPRRLVLMTNRLHRGVEHRGRQTLWRGACRAAALPGLDRALSHGARVAFTPRVVADRLSAQRNRAARDLLRHAFADVGGNGNRARAWARFARRWPRGARLELLDAYPRIDVPVLLLWAEQGSFHDLAAPREALDLLPDAQLRILPDTGFLMAYDDPVGLARELIAFGG